MPAELAEELEVESHAPYLKVWAILAILTRSNTSMRMIFKDHFLLLVLGLVCLALVKAGMVGWYFMHLKFERKWVYLLIVPACVMAVFLTLMLYPDMAMKPVADEDDEEEAWIAPASDFAAARRSLDRRSVAPDGVERRWPFGTETRAAGPAPRADVGQTCLQNIFMSVSRSYRRGISIVVGTVLLSVRAGTRRVRVPPQPRLAPPRTWAPKRRTSGRFRLVERSGRSVTEADLAATSLDHARSSSPAASSRAPGSRSVMKSLQAKLEGRTCCS